jgi:hypothetical protein
MPDTPTNLALCLKTRTKLRRTSALEGGYYYGMEQILVLSNAYVYVLRLYLLIFLCLLISMHAYVHLSICLWAKEFSVGLRSMEEREVFNLVLYQERRICI